MLETVRRLFTDCLQVAVVQYYTTIVLVVLAELAMRLLEVLVPLLRCAVLCLGSKTGLGVLKVCLLEYVCTQECVGW